MPQGILLAAFLQVFLGVLLSLTSIFLILLILVQRGRGGGLTGALGGMGGQSAFGSKAGDTFTYVTIGVAAVWFLLGIFAVRFLGGEGGAFGSPDENVLVAPERSGTTEPPAGGTDLPLDTTPPAGDGTTTPEGTAPGTQGASGQPPAGSDASEPGGGAAATGSAGDSGSSTPAAPEERPCRRRPICRPPIRNRSDMLLSMTGYGEGRSQMRGLEVIAELRSINHRHLKITCRIPDLESSAALEARAEAHLREGVRRGTVTMTVRLVRRATAEDYRVNHNVLRGYLDQLREMSDDVPVHALLTLPGVVESSGGDTDDMDRLWTIVRPAIDQGLQRLNAMRRSEGEAMQRQMTQMVQDIGAQIDAIEARSPHVVAAYAQRLTDRLNQMLSAHQVHVTPADIVREVGIFADRIDISEEIVRLRSHLSQTAATLQQADGAGRRLDFLVQELFRESNTIAAKANDAEVAQRVVDVKAMIERMRELVQNVE
jgi:protein translocase SecG subunit